MTNNELSFAIFCIESMADRTQRPANEIYDLFTKRTNILYQYIVPCYDALHTQSKDYILDDIDTVLAERGIVA